mgnify:CR=1 FL=1
MQNNIEKNTLNEKLNELWNEMDKVVIGRKKELQLILTALLSQGHVLLEDLPGTGKTTMVKAFSKALDCKFNRIQCTPDLLPSDILGSSIFNPKISEFHLRKGPVFTNILLVDEINRTLPRTQSSLLECMEEGQVSIEGETYILPSPFFVLATQNPIDMEGTFALPEAQLDRFLMRLKLGYPSQKDEAQMLERVGDEIPYNLIQSKFTPNIIAKLQAQSRKVHIHSSIIEYITILANATRNHPLISIGVSPRASKSLYKTAKTWALINNRNYVIPDDIKNIIIPIWNHRLILKPEAHMGNIGAEDILKEIIQDIPIIEEEVLRI